MTQAVQALDDTELFTISATLMCSMMMDIENGTNTEGLQTSGLQLVREIMRRTGKTEGELIRDGFDIISRLADAERAQS